MMSSKNQFTLTPCPVALSRPMLPSARALPLFALLRKVSVMSVLAFAVALGFTSQAGAQTFQMEGGFIIDPVSPAGGARGSEVTYRVYADLLTQMDCVTMDGADNQCAFNVLSVVMRWNFGDFALESCEDDVDAAGDCAADGELTDDSAKADPDASPPVMAIDPAVGGSGMKRYYQVADSGGAAPAAVLAGGKIKLLQVDASNPSMAQAIYDSVILTSNVLPGGTGQTTLTVLVLNNDANISCVAEDGEDNSCDKFALFEVTLYALGDPSLEAGDVLVADTAASLASPTPGGGDDVTGAGFYTPSTSLTVTLRDVELVDISTSPINDGTDLEPNMHDSDNALQILALTILDEEDSSELVNDRLKLRLNGLVITQAGSSSYLGVRLSGGGMEIAATGSDATASVTFDVSGVDFESNPELTVSVYAKDGTVYTDSDYELTPEYNLGLFSSQIDTDNIDPRELSTAVTGDTLLLTVLDNGTNIAAGGETTQVFIARADPVVPRTLNYELQLVDGSGNIDADLMPADHEILVADGEGIVSAIGPVTVSIGGTRHEGTFAFWPSTDNAGVTFSVNLSDVQGGGSGTMYTASVDTAPFNVEASRLVASGDPEIQLLNSTDSGTSATITQTLQAVAGNEDCSTDEMLPCVVDTDFPGDALVVAELTGGFAHGVNNPSISLDPAEINFVDGQADASLLVEGGNTMDTTPVVSITFSVDHSVYSDLVGVTLVFTLEDSAFDLDFDGSGELAGVSDYAILFFWETDRRSYNALRSQNIAHEAALLEALRDSILLGLLSDDEDSAKYALTAGEKLLRILPPPPLPPAQEDVSRIDFDGSGELAGVSDFAILFFWETDRKSYIASMNNGNAHEAALLEALGESISLGLLSDDENAPNYALTAGEKLLRILPPPVVGQ